MTEPHMNLKGHVMLGNNPVYSKRRYLIRRFKPGAFDRHAVGQYPSRGTGRGEEAILFEDVETGIITADVAKFEKWIEGVKP